jgi:hypothetical protein
MKVSSSEFYTYMLIGIMCLILIGHFLPNLSQFRIVEGMTSSSGYQGYEGEQQNDPMFLATKNAANISVLKSQIDEIAALQQLVEDISGQVALNSYNIKQIVDASSKQANAINDSAAENLSST